MFRNYLTSYGLQKINFFIGLTAFAFQIKTSYFLHLRLNRKINDIQLELELLKNLLEKK